MLVNDHVSRKKEALTLRLVDCCIPVVFYETVQYVRKSKDGI